MPRNKGSKNVAENAERLSFSVPSRYVSEARYRCSLLGINYGEALEKAITPAYTAFLQDLRERTPQLPLVP